MKQKENQSKVLLYVTSNKKHFLKRNEDALKYLNDLIPIIENGLNKDIDDTTKKDILINGIDTIELQVKKQWQFEKGTEQINWEALNVDLTEIRKYYNKFHTVWNEIKDHTSVENGQYVINDVNSVPNVKACYKYADTPARIEALNDANAICKMLNDNKKHLSRNYQTIADEISIIKYKDAAFTFSGEIIAQE